MLECIAVSKVYSVRKGPEAKGLANVSLVLPSTGMVFLCGASGSGKSTLLHLLAGLDRPTTGQILWKGKNLANLREKKLCQYRKKEVGYVFQEYNLLEGLSVLDNVALSLEIEGVSRKKAEEEAGQALSKVGLKDFGLRRPGELSGGQKQRVAIARALCKNPSLVLCDEPTGALDSVNSAEVFALLKKLSQDRLVVVASHDLEAAKKYGDRILTLKDGSLVDDETILAKDKDDDSKDNLNESKRNGGLGLRNISRLSCSFVKSKVLRFVIAILLSATSLTMFGIASEIYSVSADSIVTQGIMDEENTFFSLEKKRSIRCDTSQYKENVQKVNFSNQDLADMDAKTGLHFTGIYDTDLDISSSLLKYNSASWNDNYYHPQITGFAYLDDASEHSLIAGSFPEDSHDILLTDYLYHEFTIYGFTYSDDEGLTETITPEAITPESLIGKPLSKNYHICGFFKTDWNQEAAEYLESHNEQTDSKAYRLGWIFSSSLNYGIWNVGFLSKTGIQTFLETDFQFPFAYSEIQYGRKSRVQNRLETSNWEIAPYLSSRDAVFFSANASNLKENEYLATEYGQNIRFDITAKDFNFQVDASDLPEGLTFVYDDEDSNQQCLTFLKKAAFETTVNKDAASFGQSKRYVTDYRALKKNANVTPSYTLAEEKEVLSYHLNDIIKNFTYLPDETAFNDYRTETERLYRKYIPRYYSDIFVLSSNEKFERNTGTFSDSYPVFQAGILIHYLNKYGSSPVEARVGTGILDFFTDNGKDEYYTRLVSPSRKDRRAISRLLSLNHEKLDLTKPAYVLTSYSFFTPVMEELLSVNVKLTDNGVIFFLIGFVCCLLSLLMIANAISSSLASRQKDIGILRSLGVSGKEISGICLTETLVFIGISLAVAFVAVPTACFGISQGLKASYQMVLSVIPLSSPTFGYLAAIALTSGLLGSLFPILHEARETPMEAILGKKKGKKQHAGNK
jgi:ABC-type lipoprotein export system ATPase subunit/ABC-type antimicrobial peptide transport system permease subunit